MSHGLLSEPHISFTAVLPEPIRNLTVDRVQDNKVALSWNEPEDSLHTGYIIRWVVNTETVKHYLPDINRNADQTE